MTEKVIPKSTVTTADSGAHNAVDLDIVISETGGVETTAQGSGVSIGDGIILLASHNYIRYDANKDAIFEAKEISARLREGLRNEGGQDQNVDSSERHNIGNYDHSISNDRPATSVSQTNDQDFAVFTTDIGNSPTAPMIVFQNPNNASGAVRSFGYPGLPGTREKLGTETLDGEKLVETSGKLSENSFIDGRDSEFLRTDKDSSATADDGMGAIGGHSGGGVWLDQKLSSVDDRLGDVDLNNKLAGTMTYGSKGPNPNFDESKPIDDKENPLEIVTYDAENRGAGFTPITEKIYQGIGQISEEVGTENHKKETYEAGKDARKAQVRAAGDRWRGDGNGKEQFKTEIANDPEIADKVADRFADNVMISDQSVSNEDAAQAIKDGNPLSSTFDGTMFNETNYANQNVSLNVDMKGGYDVADYFVVGKGKGLSVEIGANEITVEKSFTTEEQIESSVVTGGVGTSSATQIRSHTAVDKWQNTEAIRGTGSDDHFNISDLSGIKEIDGRDLPKRADGTAYPESDKITIDPSVGPVDWQFDTVNGVENRESGYIVQGDNKVRFDNIENVGIRPGDLINGAVQTAALDGVDQDARIDLPMKDAMHILDHQQAAVLDNDGESNVGQMLESGAAFAVMKTLVQNEETSIDVSPVSMVGNAFEQVSEVLRAAVERLKDKGLEQEASENFEDLQVSAQTEQYELSRASEDASYGAEI